MAAESANKGHCMKTLFLIMALFGLVALTAVAGRVHGEGHIGYAWYKIDAGQTFVCMSEPFPYRDGYYAIVKIDDVTLMGLQFNEKPPHEGVAALQSGKIVFLPITSGVTIPNPNRAPDPAHKTFP